jgi:hypothetical protein
MHVCMRCRACVYASMHVALSLNACMHRNVERVYTYERWMRVCIFCVCMYVCMHVCVYAYLCICMYVCIHVCVYAHMLCCRVCVYVSMHALLCMCVCIYACWTLMFVEISGESNKGSTHACSMKTRSPHMLATMIAILKGGLSCQSETNIYILDSTGWAVLELVGAARS